MYRIYRAFPAKKKGFIPCFFPPCVNSFLPENIPYIAYLKIYTREENFIAGRRQISHCAY